MKKNIHDEFMFVRERLQTIAKLLVDTNEKSIIEAAFMVGCLYYICLQNALDFKDNGLT